MAVRELLLQLTGQAVGLSISSHVGNATEIVRDKYSPLLDPVEALQGRDGDKDDNCLLAVANFDLFQIQSQHASSRMTPQSLDRSRPIPRAGWMF